MWLQVFENLTEKKTHVQNYKWKTPLCSFLFFLFEFPQGVFPDWLLLFPRGLGKMRKEGGRVDGLTCDTFVCLQ